MRTPEAIDVVGQAEQERLLALRGKGTARCFGREFAFDCTEERLGMDALSIAFERKSGTHLCAHSVNLPPRFTLFGWNDALGTNLFTDVPVVAFAIKLCVSHSSPNAVAFSDLIEQRSQRGAVIDRSAVSLLRQDQAQIRIDSQ
jgi:hypothetical protein